MTNTFESLGLRAELVAGITEMGYEQPTAIQERAIPALLEGRDVLGQAQTGTGKTAAFSLPMLDRLDPDVPGVQGLVLTPTRELALQVADAISKYGVRIGAKVVAIYGGSSYARQLRALRDGGQIVVGTPGRMIDLIERGALKLATVRYLVLDEADEMLKMGFVDDVERIMKETPEERQTALFSATMPAEVKRLTDHYMRDPVHVAIQHKTLTVSQTEQRHYLVDEDSKLAATARLLEVEDVKSALIFTRTKLGAARLAETLMGRGYPVEAIHGDLSQEARETVMRRFRSGIVNVLVATDVVARGLDIESVSHVINFDLPYDPEDYVHRIGRTGRAGREGVAITLVTPRERRALKNIEYYTKQPIPRMKLPSSEEVLARRDERFAVSLTEMLEGDELARERAQIAQMVEAGYDASHIAAAAMRMARMTEALRPMEEIREIVERDDRRSRDDRFGARDHGDRRPFGRERERSGREEGMVRLVLDVGRANGIQPGDVVGAVASEAGIPGKSIGAIDIKPYNTYFDVREEHAEKVLRSMSRSTIRGRAVRVMMAGDERGGHDDDAPRMRRPRPFDDRRERNRNRD